MSGESKRLGIAFPKESHHIKKKKKKKKKKEEEKGEEKKAGVGWGRKEKPKPQLNIFPPLELKSRTEGEKSECNQFSIRA